METARCLKLSANELKWGREWIISSLRRACCVHYHRNASSPGIFCERMLPRSNRVHQKFSTASYFWAWRLPSCKPRKQFEDRLCLMGLNVINLDEHMPAICVYELKKPFFCRHRMPNWSFLRPLICLAEEKNNETTIFWKWQRSIMSRDLIRVFRHNKLLRKLSRLCVGTKYLHYCFSLRASVSMTLECLRI